MTEIALGLILLGLSAYLLFGGADFGAGVWHAVVRGRRERAMIEHAMGPLWEANHVWLIFVMVLTWTVFPGVFADIAGRFWVPLSFAALGIVARGSALAFRKVVPDRYAVTFATASLLTPFCLGAVAGAVATGASSWLALAPIYAGLLTVGLCAYLAAAYLTWDAGRLSGPALASRFRSYALATGAIVGALALPGAIVFGVRSPLIGLSAAAGLVSLVLLWRRRYLAVRVSAALATGAVLWGAAALSRLDLTHQAAAPAVLRLVLIVLAAGGVILLPSLVWLYLLFQRPVPPS
jgi:cytochrome bd ubiquinol oxidase subunit II